MQRDNFGDRQISVTDYELLAGSHALEERTELILQLCDVHGTHMAIIAIWLKVGLEGRSEGGTRMRFKRVVP